MTDEDVGDDPCARLQVSRHVSLKPHQSPAATTETAMLTRRHLLAASTAGLLAPGTSFVPRALAQAIKKPAHVIVGFPAGGGTAVLARIHAHRLPRPYPPPVPAAT